MACDQGRGPSKARRMHGCATPGCPAWLPSSAFVCRPCRRLIPDVLWAAVWRTWDGGRGWGSDVHELAREDAAAVAAVARDLARTASRALP